MATQETRSALLQMIVAFSGEAEAIIDRDPAFWGRLGVTNRIHFVGRLMGFVDKFNDATAINIVNNELKAAAAAINQTFGTFLSAPQHLALPVTPLTTSAPLTPQDVATFGTGVEFSALDPALVEAAAILAPESEAAAHLAAQQEPISQVLGTTPLVPDDAPVLPVFRPLEAPFISATAEPFIIEAPLRDESTLEPVEVSFVGPPLLSFADLVTKDATPVAPTFQELTIEKPTEGVPGPTLTSLLEVQEMAHAPLPFTPLQGFTDPFISSQGTSLPTSGGPNIFASGGFDPGFDIPDIIQTGVDIFSGDLDLKGLLDRLLKPEPTTGGSSTDQTFLPQPANDKDLEQRIIDILMKFPALSVLGGVGRVSDLVKGALQPGTAPLAGSGLRTLNGCVVPEAVVAPQVALVNRAPAGYVIVECNGVKVAMLKEVAMKMGKFKRRPKPPISASDWKSLRKAETVKKKAKRIASVAGFSCATKGSRRRATAHK